MRISTFRTLGLLLALCLGGTKVVRADSPTDDQARAHFEAAQGHFDTGAYEDAIGEFEQAYQLSGRAPLLYNIYLCHERLGDLNAAIDYLTRYLDADPEASNAALQVRLTNLRRRADASQPEVEPSPVQEPTLAQPVARVADSTPAGPRGYRKGPIIAALSLGGAGFLSFGAFALMSAQKDAELDSSCADACADSQVKDLRTYSLIADVSLGIGVTGLVVGGALWWVGRRRSAAQALRVAPVLGQGNVGLAAEGHF